MQQTNYPVRLKTVTIKKTRLCRQNQMQKKCSIRF